MEPYLSIVIPAYNEEKRVQKTLERIEEYLHERTFSWEIVVVIDGAHDNTHRVVSDFSKGKENVHIINRAENRGKGYTVREGMLAARGQIRLFTDADNSTDIAHFDKMKPFFEKEFQVVIASRDPKDAPGAMQVLPQPALKRLLGNLGNLFIQGVAVPGIWDTQCGFKAFANRAAEKIFAVSEIDRWGFDIEALALARHFGFKIAIIPAHWVNDVATHVTLAGYIRVLFETVKVRWNLLTRVYDRAHKTVVNSV